MDRKDSVQEWLNMGGRLLRSFGVRIATSLTCRLPSSRFRADTMPGGGSGKDESEKDESGSLLDKDPEVIKIVSTTVTTPLTDSESQSSSLLNASQPGSSNQETKYSQTDYSRREELPRTKPSRWTSKILLSSLFGNMSRYGPNRARFSVRLFKSDKKVNACSTIDSENPRSSQVDTDDSKRRKLQVENPDSPQGDTTPTESSKLNSDNPSPPQPDIRSPVCSHLDSDNPSSSQADPSSPESSHLLDSPNNIRASLSSPESCHLYENPTNSHIDDSPPESSHADSNDPISPILSAKVPGISEIESDSSNRSQVDSKAQGSPQVDNAAPSPSQVDIKASACPQSDQSSSSSKADTKATSSPEIDPSTPSTSSQLPGVNTEKPIELMETYGGCVGPNATYLKLVSSDGHEFVIKREHALMSGTIKKMLSGPGEFSEGEMNIIYLRSLTGRCLRTVCSYLAYKYNKKNATTFIPEFPISQEEAGDLLIAGHCLDC